jgi:hypothetical protein
LNQTIEIIVKPNGESRVETKGFTGNGCQTASRFVRDALGQQVAEQLKSEFYAEATVEQQKYESN